MTGERGILETIAEICQFHGHIGFFFDDPTVNYRSILFNTEVRKQISLTLRFQKCEVGM